MLGAIKSIADIFKSVEHASFKKSEKNSKNTQLSHDVMPMYISVEGYRAHSLGVIQSITARLPGFKWRFEKALSPLVHAKTVDDMKKFFQELPQVVELAQSRPDDARRILAAAAQTRNGLFAHFTAVACGVTGAVLPAMDGLSRLSKNHALALDCIRRVARHRPYEAHHLTKKLFENPHIPTNTRLAIFREIAMTRGFADKWMLTGGFEMLMAGSTPAERNDIIYPALMDLIEKWKPLDRSLNVKRAMVGECLRGWISSCAIITDDNHRRARHLLMLPLSARG